MSERVTNSDWELCLRVLQACSRGEGRKWENERWKTLLNSLYRKLRKEANRIGETWPTRKPILREPSCIQTLRLLALSPQNRQLAVECSHLRPVLWKLRREIRLDLRSEPSPGQSCSPGPSDAEMTRAVEVLQAAKDSPKDIPSDVRPELARALHKIWRQARRDSRRRRLPPQKLTPGDCRACERELLQLCEGLRADHDYRVFKGLLAKVARAFEKDIHQGRSSAEERRPHKAEDAGSSPAGPESVNKNGPRLSSANVSHPFEKDTHLGRSSVEERRPHKAEDAGSSPAGPDFVPRRQRVKRNAPRPSLLQRFFQWIRPR